MAVNFAQHIAQDPDELIAQVRKQLNGDGLAADWTAQMDSSTVRGSAVLFLLTRCKFDGSRSSEPCLILNKRSKHVLQPGDLCCPGGGVEAMDALFAQIMRWPLSPLSKWPQYKRWRVKDRRMVRELSLLLSTGLRESWEEMRLNPLQVRFLGPLQVQKLVMFDRLIYPLACWVPDHQQLRPNWEVERIVTIPLRRLMDSHCYGRFRLSYVSNGIETHRKEDFPCYMLDDDGHHNEVLWGATFRITMDFLKRVYGFEIPNLDRTPLVRRRLGHTYLNGSLMARNQSATSERSDDY